MSVWTSNYAIMRDLSKAQGRMVPVDMNSTVGVTVSANEKPPQLASEDTEHEFYKSFVSGDVDYSTAPDFGLIQQMLEIVKGNDDSSDTSIDGDLIQISKLNNHSKPSNNKQPNDVKVRSNGIKIKQSKAKTKPNESKVKTINTELKESKVIPTGVENLAGGDTIRKKKPQRNVAVISLLAALESKEKKEPLKLLKPTDFISTKAVTESVKKVDEWFTNKENSVPKQAKNTLSLTSFPMFKKKSVSETSVKQSHRCVQQPQTSPSKSTETYKPSSKAHEYYQKFLEKSQLNNCIKEDIWQKAERLMKEADAKRVAKAAQMLEADTKTDEVIEDSLIMPQLPGLPDLPDLPELRDLPDLPDSESSTKLELVMLAEQRHESSTEEDDCVVCAAVRKHGYSLRARSDAL